MKLLYRNTKAILFSVLLIGLLSSAWAQMPKVGKVEPPNWWVGMPHDPVLLLTGDNLQQAKVTSQFAGIVVTRSQSSSDGHYLFVWIRIKSHASAAKAELNVSTAAGSSSFVFPIEKRTRVSETGKGIHEDDVLYLIMPDRFANGDPGNDDPAVAHGYFDRNIPKAYHGGDLKGVQQHLGYLKELGVTAIWLTPWWKNDSHSGDYHGYHVTDFYAVDDHFGTMQDLQELVAAAHQQGIKVVSDYVANHIGPNHVWAQQPPTPTWLHGTVQNHLEPMYDFWPLVDIHSTLHDRRPVLEGWFAGKLPDLDPDDPLLEEYLADNAIWWMESAHFDGYRLDTFPYSSRESWGKWHRTLRECYPQVTSVGEVFNEDPVVTAFYEGGRMLEGVDSGATSVFDFPLYATLRSVLLGGESATRLTNLLQHDYLYQRPYGLYTFFGNHDLKRFMGEPGATAEKLDAAFSLLLTLRGIPGIYYGDEIAMTGGDDPDNRHDFPGGWKGDARSAFISSGRTAQEQSVFAHVQQLTRLRREHPALQRGELISLAASDHSYAFLRREGDDQLLVVLNTSSAEQTIQLGRSDTPLDKITSATAVLDARPLRMEPGVVSVPLAPMSVAIYSLK
jgi:glycosidase